MADPIYKNSTVIGDGKSDIILNTSGKVIIKVKNKYNNLSFNNDEKDNKDKEDKDNQYLPNILLLDSTDNDKINSFFQDSITENSLVFTGDNYLYLKILDNIYTYRIGFSDYDSIQNLSVSTLNVSELNVSSSNLVKNLNANYLNGKDSNSFIKYEDSPTITKEWIFDSTVTLSKTKSKNDTTILDYNNSFLKINSITVNNLTILNNDQDSSNSFNLEYIDTKVFIGQMATVSESFNILKVKKNYNENWDVGGEAILTLILNAIDQGYLEPKLKLIENKTVNESEIYYINLMLDVSKTEDFTELYEISESDFDENGTYLNYYYRIKDLDNWVNIPYNTTSNAKIGIYGNYFDKSVYSTILNEYQGSIFNCTLDNTKSFKLGNIITYKVGEDTISAIVTNIQNNIITILVNGEYCEESEECLSQYYPNDNTKITVVSTENYIGDISGITDPIFGEINSYGIFSKGNCYFTNPSIAFIKNGTNFIKFTENGTSFIGLKDNDYWISINEENCELKRNSIYDINNYKDSCHFGPLTVNKDGSATIGSGTTQISISKDGEVNIPATAVK